MKKVLIIAEIGVNHNGSIDIAKELIDKAKDAGADAVKFQTFRAENIVSLNAEKAEYQIQNTSINETQYQMLKKLELSKKSHIELLKYCDQKNIIFLSSPFDLASIDFLDSLKLEVLKIPSGEITNLPYLRKIASLNKKIILSTGMSDLGEIESALDILKFNGTLSENITLLQCNTDYPTNFEDVNLRAMITIKNAFGVKVGLSDHTLGIEVPIAAVALGAEVIEKHFTLDKFMEGPDHKASLVPSEFKQMAKGIRNIEISLGDGVKKITKSEMKNISIVRKSIVAKREIKKGEKFSDENLTTKRPGNGLSPMMWNKILNKIAVKNFDKDEQIII